jgi:hypothetical protein
LPTGKALDAAIEHLRKGYKEIAPGVFKSADGTRMVRMTNSDLAKTGNRAGVLFLPQERCPMTVGAQPSLDEVLDLVRTLDDSSVGLDGTTGQFLEVRRGASDQVVSVNGNVGGLVHLARLVLEVAAKGFVGAHQHFDEAGEADVCEVPLVVCFKPAEWDAQ